MYNLAALEDIHPAIQTLAAALILGIQNTHFLDPGIHLFQNLNFSPSYFFLSAGTNKAVIILLNKDSPMLNWTYRSSEIDRNVFNIYIYIFLGHMKPCNFADLKHKQ